MELRTYILIDSMQPQFAALTGILMQGDVPVEGMAEVFMELAGHRFENRGCAPGPAAG